jgi:glycosyltransferase involved in cell wall biosynthesis
MVKTKVLVISHDKVGPSMAGPGIRYHQIATELSKHFDVTLATFNPSYLEGLKDTSYNFKDIKVFDFHKTFDEHDVIFALWLSTDMIAYAKQKGKLLVFDLYAPVPVEDLVGRVFAGKTQKEEDFSYKQALNSYKDFFKHGDYFVCSNPIQRDYWMGYAFAAEGVLPGNVQEFPIYDRIGMLPMGIDLGELKNKKDQTKPIRSEFPSIAKDDFVIVWTGGIWDWFDGTTPIDAINLLVKNGTKNIKLVFLGTKHPNSDIPEMSETGKTIALAEEHGLLNKYVFFKDGWIPYQDRLDYLLEADATLYAHRSELEARYSHRTRVLDHILCELPTIATHGDYLADVVSENGLGIIVPPQDIDAMAKAIKDLASRGKLLSSIKLNIRTHQPSFTWETTTKELVDFLKVHHEPRTSEVTGSPLVKKGRAYHAIKQHMPVRLKKLAKRILAD